MARISIMFEDTAGDNVDLHVNVDGVVKGAPPTRAQLMVVKLLENVKADFQALEPSKEDSPIVLLQ